MSANPVPLQSQATFEALVHRLQMAEVRFTVMAHQLPGLGLQETAAGCETEAAAIRTLLQRVPA